MTPGVVVVWSEHNAEALKWYRLAADQGDSTAQYNVGLFYDVVVWSEHNAGALKWYTRLAADQGRSITWECFMTRGVVVWTVPCLLYTSPSPRDRG